MPGLRLGLGLGLGASSAYALRKATRLEVGSFMAMVGLAAGRIIEVLAAVDMARGAIRRAGANWLVLASEAMTLVVEAITKYALQKKKRIDGLLRPGTTNALSRHTSEGRRGLKERLGKPIRGCSAKW